MRIFITTILITCFCFTSTSQSAAAKTVAESDTGIIFPQYNCELVITQTTTPTLQYDEFHYLWVKEEILYECVTYDGVHLADVGADVVWFPTAEYDTSIRGWRVGNRIVAKKRTINGQTKVELESNLKLSVLSHMEAESVTFVVKIETLPNTP